MSHEDCQRARYKISCQQGRTLLLLLTLLTTYVPGQLARTVIIGQGRKIIADLGERPVPQLAPRPRIGEDAFLLLVVIVCSQANLDVEMRVQRRQAEWCPPIQRPLTGDKKR